MGVLPWAKLGDQFQGLRRFGQFGPSKAWRSKQVELLTQLLSHSFKSSCAVRPVGPACGNRQNDGIRKAQLPQVLQNLRVFVVLYPVADRLQPDSRCRLRRGNGARWIQEDAIAGPAQTASTRGGVYIVPAADGIPGRPAVRAIVKDARGA